MGDADALVAKISASSDDDFPARVGMTAEQLGRVAQAHFDAKPALLRLCQTLRSNQETGAYKVEARAFDGQDAKVIAYFLRRNAALSALQCVLQHHGVAAMASTAARLGSSHPFPRSLEASRVRDEGAAALGEALKVNSSLSFLECVASSEAGCRGGYMAVVGARSLTARTAIAAQLGEQRHRRGGCCRTRRRSEGQLRAVHALVRPWRR